MTKAALHSDMIAVLDGLEAAVCMIPPSMNLIFTPDMLTYGLIYPLGPTNLSVSVGLFTHGGWCMPQSTVELPDFNDRVARTMEVA